MKKQRYYNFCGDACKDTHYIESTLLAVICVCGGFCRTCLQLPRLYYQPLKSKENEYSNKSKHIINAACAVGGRALLVVAAAIGYIYGRRPVRLQTSPGRAPYLFRVPPHRGTYGAENVRQCRLNSSVTLNG